MVTVRVANARGYWMADFSLAVVGREPVSYTHLDVYKRQLL